MLRCPQGLCNERWRKDKESLDARAKHGTHMWPLWAAVSHITVSPVAPVRLVQYVGTWVGEGKRGSL